MPAARAKKGKDAPTSSKKPRERKARPLDYLLDKNKGTNRALLRPPAGPGGALQAVYEADAMLRQSVRLEAQSRLADSSVEAYNYWAEEFEIWATKKYAGHPVPTCVDESKLLAFLDDASRRDKKKMKLKKSKRKAVTAVEAMHWSDDESDEEEEGMGEREEDDGEEGHADVDVEPLGAPAAPTTVHADSMDVDPQPVQPAGTGEQKLSLSTLEKAAAAVVNLWKMQKALGYNNHPNPRGEYVRDFLSNLRGRKADWDYDTYAPRLNPLNKGYPVKTLLELCKDLLNQPALSGLRAHTGQLLSHACLFRGEAVRRLELVDMAVGYIGAEEEGNVAQFLAFRLTKGKTNKHGKLKMTACLRHRDPLRCPVFAVALYLFWRFHTFEEPFPDLSQPERWYRTKLLKGKKYGQELTYKDHAKYISEAFHRNGLAGAPHTTHAPRAAGAMEAESKGVHKDEIARLGHWVTAGSSNAMVEAYLHLVPQSTMRALSGFRKEGEDYFLPRDAIDPPPELLAKVFPDVDKWREELKKAEEEADEPEPELEDEDDGEDDEAGEETGDQPRQKKGKKKSKKKAKKTSKKSDRGDGGVRAFLDVLTWLRKVFLQDIYRLQEINPRHPVLRDDIFRLPAFEQWANDHKQARETVIPPLHSTLREVAPHMFDEVSAVRSEGKATAVRMDAGFKEQRSDMKALAAKLDELSVDQRAAREENKALLRNFKYVVHRAFENQARQVAEGNRFAAANMNTAVTNMNTAANHMQVMGSISNDVQATREMLTALTRDDEAPQADPSGSTAGPSGSTSAPAAADDETMAVDEREDEGPVRPQDYPLLDLTQISQVSQVWREYDEGINGLLSLKERESRWGYTWCGEKSNCAKRKQYTRRMFLNRDIERFPAGPEREQQIERLQKRCTEEFKGSVRSLAEWFEKKHAADKREAKELRARL